MTENYSEIDNHPGQEKLFEDHELLPGAAFPPEVDHHPLRSAFRDSLKIMAAYGALLAVGFVGTAVFDHFKNQSDERKDLSEQISRQKLREHHLTYKLRELLGPDAYLAMNGIK